MLYALLLFTIMVDAGQSSESNYEGFLQKCSVVLTSPGIEDCCKISRGKPSPMSLKAMDECSSSIKEDSPGDQDECFVMKMGFKSSDGKINKEKLEMELEIEFSEEPSIMEALKKHCIEGDISAYGPDGCISLQLANCMDIQMLGNCPKWSNESQCVGFEEIAANCYKNMYQ